jgi:hypothetical protein
MKHSKSSMAEGYGQASQTEGTGCHGDREINKSRAFDCEDEDNKCMNKARVLHNNRTKKMALFDKITDTLMVLEGPLYSSQQPLQLSLS